MTDMRRRQFLGSAALATSGLVAPAAPPAAPASTFGGVGWADLHLPELRQRYRAELFDVFLPFWDAHGIDHEHGGFMCALDHDGTRVNTHKYLWFQGRGIWVYSHLFNRFGRDPRHLE